MEYSYNYLDKCMEGFLDDILIYSHTLEDASKICITMHLESMNCMEKFINSHFMNKKFITLRYIILGEGFTVYWTKVKSIIEWSMPTNVQEVFSFMGLVGYYRRFVEGLCNIVNPITKLQKMDKKFL